MADYDDPPPSVDDDGRCPQHPFLRLQRRSGQSGGWVTLLDVCPLCASDASDVGEDDGCGDGHDGGDGNDDDDLTWRRPGDLDLERLGPKPGGKMWDTDFDDSDCAVAVPELPPRLMPPPPPPPPLGSDPSTGGRTAGVMVIRGDPPEDDDAGSVGSMPPPPQAPTPLGIRPPHRQRLGTYGGALAPIPERPRRSASRSSSQTRRRPPPGRRAASSSAVHERGPLLLPPRTQQQQQQQHQHQQQHQRGPRGGAPVPVPGRAPRPPPRGPPPPRRATSAMAPPPAVERLRSSPPGSPPGPVRPTPSTDASAETRLVVVAPEGDIVERRRQREDQLVVVAPQGDIVERRDRGAERPHDHRSSSVPLRSNRHGGDEPAHTLTYAPKSRRTRRASCSPMGRRSSSPTPPERAMQERGASRERGSRQDRQEDGSDGQPSGRPRRGSPSSSLTSSIPLDWIMGGHPPSSHSMSPEGTPPREGEGDVGPRPRPRTGGPGPGGSQLSSSLTMPRGKGLARLSKMLRRPGRSFHAAEEEDDGEYDYGDEDETTGGPSRRLPRRNSCSEVADDEPPTDRRARNDYSRRHSADDAGAFLGGEEDDAVDDDSDYYEGRHSAPAGGPPHHRGHRAGGGLSSSLTMPKGTTTKLSKILRGRSFHASDVVASANEKVLADPRGDVDGEGSGRAGGPSSAAYRRHRSDGAARYLSGDRAPRGDYDRRHSADDTRAAEGEGREPRGDDDVVAAHETSHDPLHFDEDQEDMPCFGTNNNCDARGRCIRHPHIRMRKKKLLGGWKVLYTVCPDCCLEEMFKMQAHKANARQQGRESKANKGGGGGGAEESVQDGTVTTCSVTLSSGGSPRREPPSCHPVEGGRPAAHGVVGAAARPVRPSRQDAGGGPRPGAGGGPSSASPSSPGHSREGGSDHSFGSRSSRSGRRDPRPGVGGGPSLASHSASSHSREGSDHSFGSRGSRGSRSGRPNQTLGQDAGPSISRQDAGGGPRPGPSEGAPAAPVSAFRRLVVEGATDGPGAQEETGRGARSEDAAAGARRRAAREGRKEPGESMEALRALRHGHERPGASMPPAFRYGGTGGGGGSVAGGGRPGRPPASASSTSYYRKASESSDGTIATSSTSGSSQLSSSPSADNPGPDVVPGIPPTGRGVVALPSDPTADGGAPLHRRGRTAAARERGRESSGQRSWNGGGRSRDGRSAMEEWGDWLKHVDGPQQI